VAALTDRKLTSDSLRVVLASGNAGKLRELKFLMDGVVQLVPQSQFVIESVEETGSTFSENALIKARHASKLTGLPAIADDSGLEVDYLNGEPGIRSARYAGDQASDQENIARLLANLAGAGDTQRTARFRCVMVFVRSDDDSDPLIARGAWQGRIGRAQIGVNGFGYDPVFVDAKSGLTAAQLDDAEKNRRSHRGMAARELRDLIAAWIAGRKAR
jgi:XTP/dITP diphosphohydrolase